MKTKDVMMYVLGGLIVLCFFALMGVLVIFAIPPANKEILTLVVGALLTSFSMVVGYFYGSSKGSSDKNELLLNTQPPEKI